MGTMVGDDNGHNNFYFDTCDAPFSQHYLEDTYPDGIDAFGSGRGPYEWATAREAEGTRTIIIPHSPTLTQFNWSDAAYSDHFRRLGEVYSEWGFSMLPAYANGSFPRALQTGNHMGFIASSDNHVGWMGNPLSVKNVTSGLAAFFAPTATRADIFEAMESRSTYATTGARIIVEVQVEDGGSVGPGAEYVASLPTFSWTVHGTNPVWEVGLMQTRVGSSGPTTMLARWLPGALDASGSYEWTGYDGGD